MFVLYCTPRSLADFDVRAGQLGRLQVAVGRAVAGVDQVVGPHVRHPPGDFVDRHVVDVEADRFAHLHQRGDFGGALRRFGDPQRAGLNEDLDAGQLLELFDDCHAVDQHARVLGIAAQLAEQPGRPAGRAVAEPLALQNEHARAAAGKLHGRAQSGHAAADDDHVRCIVVRHGQITFISGWLGSRIAEPPGNCRLAK